MSRATAGTGETTDTALAVVNSGSGETLTAARASVAQWERSYKMASNERYYPSAPSVALEFPVVVAIHHASLIEAARPHAFIAGEVDAIKIIKLLRILTDDPENIILIGHAHVMALTSAAASVQYKFTSSYDNARCTAEHLRNTHSVFIMADSPELAQAHKLECETNYPGATFYTAHYDSRTSSASLRVFSETNLMTACAQPALAVEVQKSTALSLLMAIKTQAAPSVGATAADTRMAPAREVTSGVGLFAAAAPAATAEGAVTAVTASPALTSA